jgi:transglutaminase-like putative cysteine protease
VNDLAVRVEGAAPPASLPDAERMREAARAWLARDRSPIVRIAPETPVPLREAMFSELADEGVDSVRPIVARVASDVWRAHCAAAPSRCVATDLVYRQRLAAALLDAVHDLAVYKPDPVEKLYDFASRVPETLRPRRGTGRSQLTGRMRGWGDCEDLSILYVALARAAGFRAMPVWVQQDGAFQNHVAAVVYLPTVVAPSGEPRWAETTIEGAQIGEHPWVVVERLGHGPRVFGETP